MGRNVVGLEGRVVDVRNQGGVHAGAGGQSGSKCIGDRVEMDPRGHEPMRSTSILRASWYTVSSTNSRYLPPTGVDRTSEQTSGSRPGLGQASQVWTGPGSDQGTLWGINGLACNPQRPRYADRMVRCAHRGVTCATRGA